MDCETPSPRFHVKIVLFRRTCRMNASQMREWNRYHYVGHVSRRHGEGVSPMGSLRRQTPLLTILVASFCCLFWGRAAAQPPLSEKQQVLWQKLENSIGEVDRN